jgi:hypothetical protein
VFTSLKTIKESEQNIGSKGFQTIMNDKADLKDPVCFDQSGKPHSVKLYICT